MKKLVVAGSPGVGKTLVTAYLLKNLEAGVFVDGKVDVPVLFSFFSGQEKREPFKVKVPVRNFMLCASCGLCAKNCPFGAIYEEDLWIDPLECEGCGVCAQECPQRALEMAQMQVAEWVKVENGSKILFYGKLMPGALGGALLVEKLWQEAEKTGLTPLIAETAGLGEGAARLLARASHLLLVLDPSTPEECLSRASALGKEASKYVLFNQSGLNPSVEDRLLAKAQQEGFKLLARLPYQANLASGYRAETLEKLPLEELSAVLELAKD